MPSNPTPTQRARLTLIRQVYLSIGYISWRDVQHETVETIQWLTRSGDD